MICEGCDKPLNPVEAAMTSRKAVVCLDCVKARARTATTGGRCKCGKKARPGAELGSTRRGARRWIPCNRCLGVIRQVA